MTRRIKNMPSIFRGKEKDYRRRVLVLGALAFGLLAGRALAQTEGTNPSPQMQMVDASPGLLKKLSLEELMDLDVTSVSKQAEPYGQAPAAIEVITNDEIRRSGASSLPEALRLADNLDVAQVTSAGWDISARGFNSSVSDKLLVLIDGRSIYTPLFAGVIWNLQDYLLEDIDRIEVISGPGGTLWGANAVNGVINITSKNAKDTQGIYLEAGGGTWLEDFTGVRYGGKLASDIYFRVYGKYFDRGPEVFSDGMSAQDSWNKGQGGFRIDAGASTQDQFTLQGDLYEGNTNVIPGGEGNPQAQGSSSGGNVLGRWTHVFEKDSDMTLQIYYDRTHLVAPFQGSPGFPAFFTFPASPAIPPGNLVDDLDTYDMDFQHRFLLAAWDQVIWGFGYRFTHDVDQAAPVVAFVPGTLDHNLFSGFIQDEIKPFENLSLTLGSKVEHNDYTGYEFEPSGRVRWDVTNTQMVWGAVSRAVRTPSRYDRDLNQPGPDYPYIFHLTGNSDFESESVIAYELGYRAQVAPEVSGSLSAFFNNYDNLRSQGSTIVLFNPTYLLQTYFQNNLKAQTYGAELALDYQMLDWLRLHAGYDLLQETIWVRAGQQDTNNRLNETADPANQVFLRSSMDLPGQLELDAAFRWIDGVFNNNGSTPGVVPSYAELDLRLGWHATPNIEVSVAGQNLLQDQHPEAGFPGPAQEQIARSVYGKVACRF